MTFIKFGIAKNKFEKARKRCIQAVTFFHRELLSIILQKALDVLADMNK